VKDFGPAPIDIMDGGGPDKFFASLKEALLRNEPIPDPYHDMPADHLVASAIF